MSFKVLDREREKTHRENSFLQLLFCEFCDWIYLFITVREGIIFSFFSPSLSLSANEMEKFRERRSQGGEERERDVQLALSGPSFLVTARSQV